MIDILLPALMVFCSGAIFGIGTTMIVDWYYEKKKKEVSMTANEIMKSIKDNLNSVEQNLEQIQCDDCISRQAVLDVLTRNRVHFVDMIKITSELKALPPVAPKPKTGNWIGIDEEPHEVWECDHCGFVIDGSGCIDPCDYRDTYKFCPNCGACMKYCRTLDEFIEDSKESEE